MLKSEFISDYVEFLSNNKTERMCVNEAVRLARENGFRTMDEIVGSKEWIGPGQKIYFTNKGKNFACAIIGTESNKSGVNILGAHIDSPRLDVKTQPLYESEDIAYLDTQYYGGIKKYQWTTRPLTIQGVVFKMDGTCVDISIGDKEGDPCFFISDLLPHLDKNLSERTGDKVIDGEKLDIVFGTTKLEGEETDAVKKSILEVLKTNFGIEEDDFTSAELEIVPSGKARYCGFDASMIGGYGQDDRVCAYTSLRAILDMKQTPKRTAVCVLIDKEEVGSICATGTESRWFEDVLRTIMACENEVVFGQRLADSDMISSDVTAAVDPLYTDVCNVKQSSKLGNGMVISKYNGGRGKSYGADANAEFVAKIRNILTVAKVKYQFDEMGKVDVGGGGTIASIISRLNINVIDCGVPVLNMHSPMEITHTEDVWETYLGYSAFLKH